MPGFECFTNAVIAFVYDTSIVEINAMIVFPRMVGKIRAIRIVLQVPLMFLFAGLEAPSGFSYVVPRTVFTWNFENNIALKIRGLSELWRREFSLKGFEWFVDNTDITFASKPAKRDMAKYGIMLWYRDFPIVLSYARDVTRYCRVTFAGCDWFQNRDRHCDTELH